MRCVLKKAIIENSRSVYLAVDHTKFGRNAMVNLGNITELDMLITDQPAPEEIAVLLKEHSIPFEVISRSD